jgi:L-ascorbate metabolism protein UlaG (beta-lactamase superfamily)
VLHRLLSVVDPRQYTAPVDEPDATVTLRYLGTAGFVVTAGQHTVVLDPYVSRPGPLASLRPLVPDADLIARILPRADDVVIGHAHHDHVLDAPVLCAQTGARFIGSPSACNVARAAGLPERQLLETRGREDIPSGPGMLRGLPSRHGRVYFGRVPMPGNIDTPPPWPPRLFHLRHGLVLNWLVEMGGVRIVHVDSADFIDREMADVGKTDIACLCAIGRKYSPGFVRRAVELLQPRYVMACHWDLFLTPYDAPPRLLPGVDLPGFMDEVRAAGSTPLLMPFEGTIRLAPRG